MSPRELWQQWCRALASRAVESGSAVWRLPNNIPAAEPRGVPPGAFGGPPAAPVGDRRTFLKVKPGDLVAVLNLGAPAPRGIVQDIIRKERTYVLVRLAPGWLHTCADPDNLLRLRVSPDEVAALRAKLYGSDMIDPAAASLLRTLTLAHNEISAMSTVAGFGLLTEHTLDALEAAILTAGEAI